MSCEALVWFKSSRSAAVANCVEVAHLPDGGVAVRNSKDPAGGTLIFTAPEWDAFVGGAQNGEFDRPAD